MAGKNPFLGLGFNSFSSSFSRTGSGGGGGGGGGEGGGEGGGGGGSSGSYWIATLGGTGSDNGYGVTTDSSGNAYIVGNTNSTGAGNNDLLFAKYNNTGDIQWQRTLGNANSDAGWGVTTDSSGNAYITGQVNTADLLIAKYDTLGSIQWQRTLDGGSTDIGYDITVDSSDNVYVTGGRNGASTGQDLILAKYNASGTIQWQRTLSGSNTDVGRQVAVDSSGNVYVVGYTVSTSATGDWAILVVKYNSSGTIQWQRTLNTVGQSKGDFGYGVAVDSSDNLYVAGRSHDPVGFYDLFVSKWNSSGSVLWQRTLASSAVDADWGKIDVDSSDNVYVVGYSKLSGTMDILIAKYDTSGSIQWQRTLSGAGSELGYGLAVDSSNDFYVVGRTDSTGDALLARLPGDGSLTGTYGGITYAASSLTDAASSLTLATSSYTDAASTSTDAPSSLTDAASNLTSTVTPVA